MKYIRRYNNIKIEETPGWNTKMKFSGIDLIDDTNNNAIHIVFGKKPRIEVYKLLKNGDFGERIS